MWNTKTENSTEKNPVYEQDSDGDGLPDGYEVFTLGTDPAVANESGVDSDSDGCKRVSERYGSVAV
ncbi:thrombospondin type 3 repeat-containing protein [Eubacterium sp.]|uniref:thrombospondin type 3 repeat-containing protein n=1 Tax=Eubacterium sp. TaxID=142586 RepID=UPI00399BC8C8